jgi:hypothetical protein
MRCSTTSGVSPTVCDASRATRAALSEVRDSAPTIGVHGSNRYWPQMTYPVTPVSPVAPTLPVLPVAPVAPCGRVVGSTHRGAAAKGGRVDRSLGFLVTRPGWADPHGVLRAPYLS